MNILIETYSGKESFAELEDRFPKDIEFIECRQIDASEMFTQVLVTLSPLTITIIAKIIIEHIRSKKAISAKYKGITLSGMSEKTVEKILMQIFSQEMRRERKKGGKEVGDR